MRPGTGKTGAAVEAERLNPNCKPTLVSGGEFWNLA